MVAVWRYLSLIAKSVDLFIYQHRHRRHRRHHRHRHQNKQEKKEKKERDRAIENTPGHHASDSGTK
jgi:hypothetical protein